MTCDNGPLVFHPTLHSESARVCVQAVLHASGVLQDATLHQHTARQLRAVFAPKLAGVQELLQQSSSHPTTCQARQGPLR